MKQKYILTNIEDFNFNIIKSLGKIYSLYQYNSGIQILVKDKIENKILNSFTRECYVFKNKIKVLFYKDIINTKPQGIDFYTRMIGYTKLTYSNSGILLNKESILNCKFITKNRIDLILDTKIVTFDIECFSEGSQQRRP